MAKKTNYHARDGLAKLYIQNNIPENWRTINPIDFNNREYSEDMMIEIVDKEGVTGIFFSVQNKSTTQVNKNNVTAQLSRDDIERLHNLSRRVIIHIYNVSNRIGYWIWFDEWLASEASKGWETKTKVTISIPIERVFNEEAINKIEFKLRSEHWKYMAQKDSELINRKYGNKWHVDTYISDKSVTHVWQPKSEEANFTVNFGDQNLGNAIQDMFETGEPKRFQGGFTVEGIPKEISYINTNDTLLTLVPLVSSEPIPIKFELLDDMDNVVYKIPHLLLRETKHGSKYQEWEAKSKDNSFNLKWIANQLGNTPPQMLSFSLNSKSQRVRDWLEYIDVRKKMENFTSVRITYLEQERVLTVKNENPSPQNNEDIENVHRALLILTKIERIFKIEFAYPEQPVFIPTDILESIFELGQVRADVFIDPVEGEELIILLDRNDAMQLLLDHNSGILQDVGIITEEREIKINLLDAEINLGNARKVYKKSALLNSEEVEQQIKHDNNEPIEAILSTNKDYIFLEFQNYPWKENDDQRI